MAGVPTGPGQALGQTNTEGDVRQRPRFRVHRRKRALPDRGSTRSDLVPSRRLVGFTRDDRLEAKATFRRGLSEGPGIGRNEQAESARRADDVERGDSAGQRLPAGDRSKSAR